MDVQMLFVAPLLFFTISQQICTLFGSWRLQSYERCSALPSSFGSGRRMHCHPLDLECLNMYSLYAGRCPSKTQILSIMWQIDGSQLKNLATHCEDGLFIISRQLNFDRNCGFWCMVCLLTLCVETYAVSSLKQSGASNMTIPINKLTTK